jgi:dipeptidyl aminopeptidase/acylaminoacyl peptidase
MVIRSFIIFLGYNLVSISLCAQNNFTILNDLKFGNVECFKTEVRYSGDQDLSALMKSLISYNYSNMPSNHELNLDLYLPTSNKKMPLLILAHDGAFQVGYKSDPFMVYLGENLASKQIIVASVNYGLGFIVSNAKAKETIHKSAQSLRAAVRYLLESPYGKYIDVDNIFIGGASAGGIASMYASFVDDGEFEKFYRDKVAGQAFFECMDCGINKNKTKFNIKGVISMWGAIHNLDVLENNNIPVLMFHGDKDETVPFDYDYPFSKLGFQHKSSGRLIFDKLYGSKKIKEKLGTKSELITFYNEGHSPQYIKKSNIFNQENCSKILNKIYSFIY